MRIRYIPSATQTATGLQPTQITPMTAMCMKIIGTIRVHSIFQNSSLGTGSVVTPESNQSAILLRTPISKNLR